MTTRRDFLKWVGIAPAVILTPGLLMPVRSLLTFRDSKLFEPFDVSVMPVRSLLAPRDNLLHYWYSTNPGTGGSSEIFELFDSEKERIQAAYMADLEREMSEMWGKFSVQPTEIYVPEDWYNSRAPAETAAHGVLDLSYRGG